MFLVTEAIFHDSSQQWQFSATLGGNNEGKLSPQEKLNQHFVIYFRRLI